MGIVRFLLAVSVVIAHTVDQHMVGGQFAVQLFFMISGYLISFVLCEAKSYSRTRDFYVNRALRIFPLYWIVFTLTLALHLASLVFLGRSSTLTTYSEMPFLAAVLVGMSNFTLLGQDQVMFLSVNDSSLLWTTNFQDSDVLLYQGLLVPQAWSLGVELTFYLVAPFVLVSKKRLVAFFLLSLILRFLLISLGFGMSDPWVYRFFPTELAVFLLGAISHQFLAPRFFSLATTRRKPMALFSVVLTAFLVVFFWEVPFDYYLKGLVLFGFIALVLPPLFEFQGQNKFDNFLAQLSYPIYIWHLLTLGIVVELTAGLELAGPGLVLAVLIPTVALSLISLRLVDKPIQRARVKFRTG